MSKPVGSGSDRPAVCPLNPPPACNLRSNLCGAGCPLLLLQLLSFNMALQTADAHLSQQALRELGPPDLRLRLASTCFSCAQGAGRRQIQRAGHPLCGY